MNNAIRFLLPAVGDNPSRKNLTFIHVKGDGEKAVLTAANGFVIKRVSVKSELVGEQLIPVDKVKVSKKSVVMLGLNGLFVDGGLILFYPSPTDWPYPDFDKWFDIKRYEPANINMIGLHIDQINNVLKGAPTKFIKLRFSQSLSPVGNKNCFCGSTLITFSQFPDYQAMIMPLQINW